MFTKFIMGFSIFALTPGCGAKNDREQAVLFSSSAHSLSYRIICEESLSGGAPRATVYAILEINELFARSGRITIGVGEAVPLSKDVVVEHHSLEVFPPIDQYNVDLGSGEKVIFSMNEKAATAQATYPDQDEKSINLKCSVDKK